MNRDGLVLFLTVLSWLPYLFFNRACQEKPPLLSEYVKTNFLFVHILPC